MKLVTAVIKPHKWEDVREALETFGVTGMTVSEDEEVDGIDFAEHGESAYDLDGRSGGVRTPVAATQAASHATEGAMA